MKKYFILHAQLLSPQKIAYIIIALLSIQTAIAQSVGIGTTTPNASARLEVNSTTQGILIPSLTSAQRSAISNPANGLLVFQKDGTPGFYYYTGLNWINLTSGIQPNSEGIAVSSSYGLTTTFAGNGSAGSVDGGGTATFNQPTGIAIDASGKIYVADASNNKIRSISSAGVVSTLAGSGSPGVADGTGTAASFNHPFGVAVDASGNVYVTDQVNNKIRQVSPAGVVTTFAGSGSSGAADGAGTAASFNHPFGIAVDASGNVYVADQQNNKIRKITAAGVVTTFAGSGSPGAADGIGTAASFIFPTGIAIDASGNLYIADLINNKIRKITTAGNVSTLAGSGSPGSADDTGTAASFFFPVGIAIDASGNVYVGDQVNHKIRKIIAQ